MRNLTRTHLHLFLDLKVILHGNWDWFVDVINRNGMCKDLPVFLPLDINNVKFQYAIIDNCLELQIAYYYYSCDVWLADITKKIRSHYNLWGDNDQKFGLAIIPCVNQNKCPEFGPPAPSENIAAIRYKLSYEEMIQLGLNKH